MRRTIMMLTVATAWLAATGAGAQETPRARAQRALPPEVFRELSGLADDVAGSGIPGDPLYVKALEGTAKRVPADRLLPAVRAYANRLGEARQAFGADAPTPLLVAGADALQRGVRPQALRQLPADRPRSAMAIVVLADLLESGVPEERAIAMVRQIMVQRVRDQQMLDASARVRLLIRQGMTPQDAVDQVRRSLQRTRDGSMGPPVRPSTEPTIRDRIPGTTDGTVR